MLPTEAVQSPPRSALGVPALNAAGTTSSSRTLSASDGPLLVTLIVYAWPAVPARTLARPSSVVTARTAVSTTVVVSVALLLAGTGSMTGLLTVAVAVAGPPGVAAGTV